LLIIANVLKTLKLERELPSSMVKKRTDASSSASVSATGSQALAAAQRSAAVVRDLQCDSSASAITKHDGNKLRSLGLISYDEKDVRFPGSKSHPDSPDGFTVMFHAFLHRGLSVPAHEFLRCLLFFYGIQLWQRTPNSILHLAIYITVFEDFLGIDLHWGLWRKIFYVKRHSSGGGPHVVEGGDFVGRKEINYFNFPM
jgi:hypothetical protein